MSATGVDPKIPPVDLLDADFEKRVSEHKSDRAKASEIEHAIRHHIDVNLDDDPEYYKTLSDKLKAIIQKHQDHWEALVQLLMDFRADIDSDRVRQAQDLGLSDTQFAFHNILMAEICRVRGEEALDEATHEEVIAVTRDLVAMLDEATGIVGLFDKPNEIKWMKRNIKRRIVDSSFDDPALRTAVMDRFMELARHKFRA